MTEKRFSVDNHCNLYDNEHYVFYSIEDSRKNIELLCKRLNNLVEENEQLKDDVEFLDEKIKENEWHWNTIDEDRDVWKYKCNQLTMENEGLKKRIEYLEVQLYHNSDEGVCSICKNQYLEQGKTYDKYYISKCQKGHEECSTDTLKYCDDFELKDDEE